MHLVLLGLLLAAAALPDQQAVVSRGDAKLAVDVLLRHDRVAHFCEPCGDAAPRVVPRGHVTAGPWTADPAFWTVGIDGVTVDLAYVFVPAGREADAPLVNLARLLGLPVEDVSAVVPPPR